MISKSLIVLCAQALLVKTVFSQCFSSGNLVAPNLLSSNNLLASNNLGASNLVASNLASNLLAPNVVSVNGVSNVGNVLAPLDGLSYGGVFSVASGSANAPNGVSVLADNLGVDGAVGVAGSLPFLGAVAVDGAVPSGGQGSVIYNAGPGVQLTSGGCGAGLGALNSGLTGLNNAGVVGLNNVGLNNVGVTNVGLNNVGLNNIGLNNAGLAGLYGCAL